MKNPTDNNAALEAALVKAIAPFKTQLREAFATEKAKIAEVERFNPEAAERDFFEIHGKACAGDAEAKAQLEAMPWPDLKSFAQRYRVLADANFQALEAHRKSFRPTIVAACEKMTGAVKAVAATAQAQLDSFCEATGEPAQQSQWAKHRAGEVLGWIDAILEDRAEQDWGFIKNLVE